MIIDVLHLRIEDKFSLSVILAFSSGRTNSHIWIHSRTKYYNTNPLHTLHYTAQFNSIHESPPWLSGLLYWVLRVACFRARSSHVGGLSRSRHFPSFSNWNLSSSSLTHDVKPTIIRWDRINYFRLHLRELFYRPEEDFLINEADKGKINKLFLQIS